MATTCDNCGSECGPDDVFCESCGYDFLTGTTPGETTTSADGTGSDASSGSPVATLPDLDTTPEAARAPSLVDEASREIPRVLIEISTDPEFYNAMVTEGEVPLPDTLPPPQELELFGNELHIGRTSDSRGVHPNVDVEALTGDPAVSSRHAVVRVANDGTHTITDVGSTNGTFVDDFEADPITQGVPVAISESSRIWVGAWTRLVVRTGSPVIE